MKHIVAFGLLFCLALTACGGQPTTDVEEVARLMELVDEAVEATVAAMPSPEPQTVYAERIVKETVIVEASVAGPTREVVVAATPAASTSSPAIGYWTSSDAPETGHYSRLDIRAESGTIYVRVWIWCNPPIECDYGDMPATFSANDDRILSFVYRYPDAIITSMAQVGPPDLLRVTDYTQWTDGSRVSHPLHTTDFFRQDKPRDVRAEHISKVQGVYADVMNRGLDEGLAAARLDDIAAEVGGDGFAWLVGHLPVLDPSTGSFTSIDKWTKSFGEEAGVKPDSRLGQDPVGTALDLLFGNPSSDEIKGWLEFDD